VRFFEKAAGSEKGNGLFSLPAACIQQQETAACRPAKNAFETIRPCNYRL
jgi:hypothetical protein